MTQLETQQWAQETLTVLEQARRAITESAEEPVRQLAERLPAGALSPDDDPISLAFAGAYSAGKSTIIKALTGADDIAMGVEITTEHTHSYDWNGVTIIDTPGIHSERRPDHDEISYSAIASADLLVFVITNEMFDSHLAEHYRKLTIDRGKGHETILVVNKMGRHAGGNTPEAQAIKTADLRAPLEPFTPEQMRITFIDALSALEMLDEDDPESREELQQESNLAALIANINAFVKEKGLTAQHTTVLFSIDHVLQRAIETEPSGDNDVDTMILVYNQNIRALSDATTQLRMAIDQAVFQSGIAIRETGTELAEHFYPDSSRSELEAAAEAAQARVQQAVEQMEKSIAAAAEDILSPLGERINEMHTSDLHRGTIENLTNRPSDGRDWSSAIGAAQQGTKILRDLAGRFAINPVAVAQGASGLARFSGSAAHSTILTAGRFLGYSFRPWEAVRYASFIGRAVPFLAIAGAVLSFGAQIFSDYQEDKRSREFQKIRTEIQAEFNTIAEEVSQEAHSQTATVIEDLLAEPLRQVTEHRDELNRLRQQQNAHLEHLNAASAAVNDLIRRIHAA